jgi:hypothetical protein
MFSTKYIVAGLLALAVVGTTGSLLAMTLAPAAQHNAAQTETYAPSQAVETITITPEKQAS